MVENVDVTSLVKILISCRQNFSLVLGIYDGDCIFRLARALEYII